MRYAIPTLIILLMSISTSAFSQKYTTKQVFDSVDSFSDGQIAFSPKGDLFLRVRIRPYPFKNKLFHSSDKGVSWDSIQIPRHAEYNFGINSITGSFFYLSPSGDTLFRSRDEAKTWEVFYLKNFRGTFGASWDGTIFFYPDTSRAKLIACESRIAIMSSDDGHTWYRADYPITETKYNSVAGIVSGGGGPPLMGKDGQTYHIMIDGVYYADENNSWRRSPYWKNLLRSKKNSYGIEGFALDSNQWLYAGVSVVKDKDHPLSLNSSNGRWYNSHGFFIVRSKDKGITWDTVSNFVGEPEEMTTWGRELSQLEFDREGNMIALTTEGIYRSKDSGKTFQMFDIPKFTYFGCTMTKDPWGNIYIVTTLPDVDSRKEDKKDNYGYKLISP